MEESSRRSTRAALAPSWTSAETLTLLYQIAAVDRDCGGAIIASFQKWKTISSNLSADGVHRSLDQCRRKWNTLLDAYSKVKELGSYWNLDDEIRVQIGVSEDFDLEVFKAMDAYLKKESEEEEGERENVGEKSEEPDVVADNYIVDDDRANGHIEDYEGDTGFQESGVKKQKNQQIVRKKRTAVATVSKQRKLKKRKKKKTKPQAAPILLSEEIDEKVNPLNEHKMLHVTNHQINPQINSQIEVDEEVNLLNEQKMLLATNHQSYEEVSEEEEEDEGRVLAEKLLENARNVKAITKQKLSECDEFSMDDSRDAETEFIKHQGEQLSSCLGELARAVKQLCENKHLCNNV